MGFFANVTRGLTKSRDKFKESMYELIGRGPNLDDEFWDDLEEALVLSDMGARTAMNIVERLRAKAYRENLPDAYAVLDVLSEAIENAFAKDDNDIFGGKEAVILFVGINGTGKTTTVGKIAKEATDEGRKVILGSADTFRAAAIEQLQVWAERAGVEMVTRDRGSDPASVCYETVERAEQEGDDLVLIDTAGRLHTSDDLMRELVKVVEVTRKRSNVPVYTVLVIDATTGQNGMQQAREFNKALDLDAVIVTKLDGTAKGGIALAISHELGLPVVKIGVGEGIEDLRDFDAHEYVAALIGDFEESDIIEEEEPQLEASADDTDAAASAVTPISVGATDDLQSAEVSIAESITGKPIDGSGVSEELEETVEIEEISDLVDSESGATATEETESDASEEPQKMSWAEFIEYDDKLKAEEAKSKKHFWEKW